MIAPRQSVPIDVCRIADHDAVFWQQAAHLTSGHYYRLDDASSLLQALMASLSACFGQVNRELTQRICRWPFCLVVRLGVGSICRGKSRSTSEPLASVIATLSTWATFAPSASRVRPRYRSTVGWTPLTRANRGSLLHSYPDMLDLQDPLPALDITQVQTSRSGRREEGNFGISGIDTQALGNRRPTGSTREKKQGCFDAIAASFWVSDLVCGPAYISQDRSR